MAEPPPTATPGRGARLARWALRLLGPVLLVVLVLRLPDRGAVWRSIEAAPLGILVAVALLDLPAVHLKVVRWQVLLRTRGFSVGLGRAWAWYLGSSYVGLLTPGRVGDLLRAQYLRREAGVPYAEGVASVVMDRFLDLYALLGFAAIGVARFGGALAGELAVALWASVVGAALVPLVFLVPGLAERLFRRVWGKLAAQLGREADGEEGFDRFFAALRASAGRALAVTFPLTLLSFGVNYLQGWLLGRAVGVPLGVYDSVCLLAVASLLGLVPISVSGVGVREAFFAVAFPALGASAEVGVGYGLLVFGCLYLVLAGLGAIAWQVAPLPVGAPGAGDRRGD